jgi:type II secretory pathway component GspD/PulD (secretin)
VLGQLFRQTTQLRSQKELLIFITPRIVADLAAAGAVQIR